MSQKTTVLICIKFLARIVDRNSHDPENSQMRLILMSVPLLLFLANLTSSSANAAPKWLRHVSAAAVCGAVALDVTTTRYGTAHGALELNPGFSSLGQPQWGRIIGVNLGICTSSIVLAEMNRVPDAVVFGFSGALTAVKTWAGAQNLSTIQSLNGK